MPPKTTWLEFVASDKSGTLYDLLHQCANKIYSQVNLREILRQSDFKFENRTKDDILVDLVNLIYDYLRENLKNNTHFAQLFERNDISRIVQQLTAGYRMYVADKARAGGGFLDYYRRCRESLGDSSEFICNPVRRAARHPGLPAGSCFAPAAHPDAPEAPSRLFDMDEYRTIPMPPGIYLKDIRNAASIVKAAAFFWDQAALRKGEHFFLLMDFVNFMGAHYVIEELEPLPLQGDSDDDDTLPSLQDTLADATGEQQFREFELIRYLEQVLSPDDLDVLAGKYTSMSRTQIMERFSLTEHAFKQSMQRIKVALHEYFDGWP